MDTKDILYSLRTERGLSQDELADKVVLLRGRRCHAGRTAKQRPVWKR